jgi:RNA polymerase sigma factor (sigma-70 family)
MNATDGELLRRYAKDRSEPAFTELVQRHLPLVYSAALRQTNGDVPSAEDVTQAVFTDLARKAGALVRHASLAGWLYTSTRFAASTARRTEERRSTREQEAHAMNALLESNEPEPDWAKIRPLLDEVMHTLDEPDREAVLLRHFERRTYAEIGGSFGLTENAARMRVERALEKLQIALSKRGITSTSLALAGLLAAEAVGATPAHLAANVVRAALAGGAAASGLTAVVAQLFTGAKIKMAIATVAIATVVTLMVTHRRAPAPDAREVAAGRNVKTVGTAAAISETNSATTNSSSSALARLGLTNGPSVRLQIVAADSGLPVPNVLMDYRAWTNGGFFGGQKLQANRLGICEVYYPVNISELELTTRIDDFADTKLDWHTPSGDVIPTNYVLRLDRPVPIGGRVVDAEGNPIAGAKIGWNHGEYPGALKYPQSHEFGWIEVSSDADGRWRINRIAEDMIRRLYGGVRHTSFVDSPMKFVGTDRTFEQQLRDSNYVVRLERGLTVQGTVVDTNGVPIANVAILAGYRNNSNSRHALSREDGSFSVGTCPPGKLLLSAEAEGYSVVTTQINLAADSGPIRLTLVPGNFLRLRVVDQSDKPIARAWIWYDSMSPRTENPVQADFSARTDADGRAVWTNAPDTRLTFDIEAAGFARASMVEIPADGEEHKVVLSHTTVVHGSVRDKSTGQLIPKFQVILGSPYRDSLTQTNNMRWSNFGRDWLRCSNGQYRHEFDMPMILGEPDPGYALKFIAEGYGVFISRVIDATEGDVELDVSLQPAESTVVTVYNPDGRIAAGAEVGLVSPGVELHLAPGGFSLWMGGAGAELLRVDSDGTFELHPDSTVTAVVGADSEGYAEATPAMLSTNPVLQLERWGWLEATCYSGGKPVAGREYRVDYGSHSPRPVSTDPNTSLITDANGRISAPVSPGRHILTSILPISQSGDFRSWTTGTETPFDVSPGETNLLALGTSNYTVTARLQWPAGTVRQSNWTVQSWLHTDPPLFPPEMTNNAARTAYMTTDEFKERSKSFHSYTVLISGDTLVADEVPPGAYRLSVAAYSGPTSFVIEPGHQPPPPARRVVDGQLSVVIPADPPSGTVDAGTVELKP